MTHTFRSRRGCGARALGLATFLAVLSLGPGSSLALTSEQWRADLQQLVAAIEEHHPRPFHKTPRDEFEQAVASLESRIPQLDDKAVIVEMIKLVALIADAHTRLAIPREHPELGLILAHSNDPPVKDLSLRFASLPVRFESFADGLFIVAADPANADWIGARIERIGGVSAADALERLAAVSYADNDQTRRLMSVDRLTLPGVLATLGISASPDQVSIAVSRKGRPELQTRTIKALAQDASTSLVTNERVEQALWRRPSETPYFVEPLPEHAAIYVRLDELPQFPDRPMGDVMVETLHAAQASNATRYVLDLRRNHGGSGSWASAFAKGLLHSKFNRYGSIYVLTGRETFSAAQMLINDLEEYVNVIFVGEPPGSSPSSYGDPQRLQLTHSGLTLRVSTIYWHSWLAGEFRDATSLHIDVESTSEDYFGGRDPALTHALNHVAPSGIAAQVESLFRKDKIQAGAILFLKYLNDTQIYPHDAVDAMVASGHRLLDEDKTRAGYFMMTLARDFYPTTAIAHAGQGRAYEMRGEHEDALRRYRKALELDPNNTRARAGLGRLDLSK